MLISCYSHNSLAEISKWSYEYWLKQVAHVAVIRDREKHESLNEAIKFENMKRQR